MNKNNNISNGGCHISRNKIKEMCIIATFIMKEMMKVVREK